MSDKQKNLIKLLANFCKMLNEETCETIRVNYWTGLETAIKNLQITEDGFIYKIVFEEILKKYSNDITSNKNLLFCILHFLSGIKEPNELFYTYLFDYFYSFLANYEDNKNIFNEFLGDLALSNFFKMEYTNLEIVKKFLIAFIDNDLNLFDLILKNYISFEFDDSETQILEKMIKYDDIFIYFLNQLLKKDLSENLFYVEKLNFLNFSQVEKIFKFYNNLIKNFLDFHTDDLSDEKFREYLFILIKISNNIIKLLIPSQISIQTEFLKNVEKLNLFILDNTYNHCFNLRNLFYNNLSLYANYYKLKIFKNFNESFLLILFSLSDDITDIKTCLAYLKILKICQENDQNHNFSLKTSLITKLILKIFAISQKNKYLPGDQKNLHNSVKIVINNSQDFLLSTSSNYANTCIQFYNLSNLNLISYILDNSFIFNLKETENIKLEFLENNFYTIQKVLFSLNIENYDLNFQNQLIKFIFHILLIIYEPNQNQNQDNDYSNINLNLFELVFSKIIKISDKKFLSNDIYPLVITFLQGVVFPKFNLFNKKFVDLFFNFLLEFSRVDSIANLTSKLITLLYNSKIQCSNENKIYAVEKYTELALKTNSMKTFTTYFNFMTDCLKNTDNVSIIYKNLVKFLEKTEGSVPSSLLDYVFKLFDKNLDTMCDGSEFTIETLFTLSAVYQILKNDQPENILNKMYESYYNMKLLKICEKLFKNLIFSNFEKISEKLKFEHISKIYSLNNISTENSKFSNEELGISILCMYSKLFSLFISNVIINNKESFDMKNLSDPNNKTICSLIKTFDYITCNVLSTEKEQKSISQIIFLNEFFSFQENLNFLYNTHSYFMAINHLEENNLDYSLLNDVNTKIIGDKNTQIFNFVLLNPFSIFILREAICNIFSYEQNIIYLLESKKNANSSQNKNFVVDNLYDDSLLQRISTTKNSLVKEDNKNLNSFFVKYLFDFIYCHENLKKVENENIYLFLLQNKCFLKYFKNMVDLLNFDMILVNFYNVFKKNPEIEVKKTFLSFLSFFTKSSKTVFLFSVRIFLNKNIFSYFLINESIIPAELVFLIDFIITQLVYYNSYKIETMNHIVGLLKNFENCLHKNFSNSKIYGKMITNCYTSLTTQNFDENSHTKIEINKKFKDNLLNVLNEEILPNYLKFIFSDEKKNSMNSYLDLFENYDIILNLKNLKIVNENMRVNEIEIKKLLNESFLIKNILLFTDISFPRTIFQILQNILSNSNQDEYEVSVIENYILYHIIYKHNKKLLFDIIKSLLFNKEFGKEKFSWDSKYEFISMLLVSLINDHANTNQEMHFSKWKIFKGIGVRISLNIIKRLDISSAIIQGVDEDNIPDDENLLEIYQLIKKIT